MEMQLCRFGFKKIRFDTSVPAATPNEEYDLRCDGSEGPSRELKASKAAAPAPIATISEGVPQGAPRQILDAEISGKIFLITRGGDLRPARSAQVFLLTGPGAESA